MTQTEDKFDVVELLPLGAREIRDQLRALRQIDETDAQTGIFNKDVAQARLELLSLAAQYYQIYLGMPVKQSR